MTRYGSRRLHQLQPVRRVSRHLRPWDAPSRRQLSRSSRLLCGRAPTPRRLASWSSRDLTQPRMSDLYRGKISKFSLDALMEIASKLAIRVRVEVDTDAVRSALSL